MSVIPIREWFAPPGWFRVAGMGLLEDWWREVARTCPHATEPTRSHVVFADVSTATVRCAQCAAPAAAELGPCHECGRAAVALAAGRIEWQLPAFVVVAPVCDVHGPAVAA